jgi:hypothetical protein
MRFMKQIPILLLVLALAGACGEAKKNTAGPVRDATKDSLQEATGQLRALADKFKTTKSLPYTVDTTLLLHIENYDSLGGSEVKLLAQNLFRHALAGDAPYDLATLCKIDSLKAIGKYAAWCDSLEPGNTKTANAYALCKLPADSATLLVWALTKGSYQACPTFATFAVYFSVLKNDKITQTFILGEYAVGADPPVGMERIVNGKMNKDLSFELNVHQEDDEDMDQPDIAVLDEYYKFALKNGLVTNVQEQRGTPQMVKRKKGEL